MAGDFIASQNKNIVMDAWTQKLEWVWLWNWNEVWLWNWSDEDINKYKNISVHQKSESASGINEDQHIGNQKNSIINQE